MYYNGRDFCRRWESFHENLYLFYRYEVPICRSDFLYIITEMVVVIITYIVEIVDKTKAVLMALGLSVDEILLIKTLPLLYTCLYFALMY